MLPDEHLSPMSPGRGLHRAATGLTHLIEHVPAGVARLSALPPKEASTMANTIDGLSVYASTPIGSLFQKSEAAFHNVGGYIPQRKYVWLCPQDIPNLLTHKAWVDYNLVDVLVHPAIRHYEKAFFPSRFAP